MKYQEIEGDLIALAKEGKFDVIAHGCNCFCTMGAGIAPQMAKAFRADEFPREGDQWRGDMNKLGTINFGDTYILVDPTNVDADLSRPQISYADGNLAKSWIKRGYKLLNVVNAYTQYGLGANHKGGEKIPLSYNALHLCMQKINHTFKGKHIGLPQIGCGLAGGEWPKVKAIIMSQLTDCDVTVVIYKPK